MDSEKILKNNSIFSAKTKNKRRKKIMSLKMKLTSTIMAFMLLASMLIVGVFAVKQTEFSVGGNIVFNATGIDATISAGNLEGGSFNTGSAETKMKAVTINTEKSASQLAEEYETWSGLDLAFNEAGDDVTITFTITNNSKSEKLVAYIDAYQDTSKNAIVFAGNDGAIINPDTDESVTTENTETFTITFRVVDQEINAGLTGFKVDFYIQGTVDAETSTETTLTYQGITYTKGSNNVLSLTNGKTATTRDIKIPAFIKDGDTVYTVTSVGDSAFAGFNFDSLTLPQTITTIGESAFSNCGSLKKVNLPSSITNLSNYMYSGTTVENFYYSVAANPSYNITSTPQIIDGINNLIIGEEVESISSNILYVFYINSLNNVYLIDLTTWQEEKEIFDEGTKYVWVDIDMSIVRNPVTMANTLSDLTQTWKKV